MMRGTFRSVVAGGALALTGLGANAADPAVGAKAPESCKTAISFPAFNGPIKQNPDPSCLNVGPLGEIYVGGAFTGYGYDFTNPFPVSPFPLPRDLSSRVDVSNLHATVQKPDGVFQFYVTAGAYAIPALGFVNYRAFDQTDLLFGPLPIAFGKIAINDNWSIQAGRMPTLIGTEAPFTYQNLNISRGLLFNQENIINHGVQVNYSDGPVAVSVAGTDGFYSGQLTWFTGAATYKLDDNNTIGVNGGLNLGRTNVVNQSLRYQYATPQFQQNSGIISVNYTYSNGPWTISPYLQYTNVARDTTLGITTGASTFGAAMLASYSFTDNFALAGRVEYIEQTGRRGLGTTNLLYGSGSNAFSFTITPTYTVGRFFLRGEYSRVELANYNRGDVFNGVIGNGFGRFGNKGSQDRYMIETGLTF